MRRCVGFAAAVLTILAGSSALPLSMFDAVAGSSCAPSGRQVGHPPPATTLSENDPTLADVLARYLETVGGSEAFGRIESRIVQARVITDLPTWDPPVFEVDTLTVYSKAPDKYLIIHRTPRGTMLEGFDGAEAWKRDIDGKVFAFHVSDGRDAWLVDPWYPTRLREYFPDMEFLGASVVYGSDVHAVEIDGDHAHRLYFDRRSGLLIHLGFHREFSDYRAIDGVLVPFEVEYGRKGGSSTFVFDSIVHNVEISDRIFSIPGGH
jgi:hypothetical protein